MILGTELLEIREKYTWVKGEMGSNSKSASKFSWLFEAIMYLGFQNITHTLKYDSQENENIQNICKRHVW